MEQIGYLLKEHLDVVLDEQIHDDGIDIYNVAFLLIDKNGELLDFGYKADKNGKELTTKEYIESKIVLKEKLNQLVDLAHENNKKVVISIGGHPNSVTKSCWTKLLSSNKKIANFIREISDFIREYDLDGVDIDCETLTFCRYSRYVTFIGTLRTYFVDKIVSIAISATPCHIFGNCWQWITRRRTVYDFIDHANVMAYDFPTSCCVKNHSKVGFARFSLDGLNSVCGVPKQKQRLGIPLYGRKGRKTLDYRTLVGTGADPSLDKEQYNGFYYETFDSLKQKVDLGRERAGGFMYWSLKMDVDKTNPKSILKRVDDFIKLSPKKSKSKCRCCWICSFLCCFP
jgi:hypothetical protein